MARDLHGLAPVLPVASGGLHPGLVSRLVDELGTTLAVQAGGGVHGHPDGAHAGARALRRAVDAAVVGQPPESAAEDCPELATALDRWETETPRWRELAAAGSPNGDRGAPRSSASPLV